MPHGWGNRIPVFFLANFVQGEFGSTIEGCDGGADEFVVVALENDNVLEHGLALHHPMLYVGKDIDAEEIVDDAYNS
jgi:hypothetical protein